jgi:alpha-L-rhamnosidase
MGDMSSNPFVVTDVRFEHHLPNDALDIGSPTPRISWKVAGTPPGFAQERYEMAFFANKDQEGKSLLHSLVIKSPDSILVPWPLDSPLTSRQGFFVRVRVWGDNSASPSEWSELSYVEAGLLQRSDWKCQRISSSWEQNFDVPSPEELYRKQFHMDCTKKITKARLYITAQGLYEAEINGKRVGDQFLAPGWSAYDERLHYQVYDVEDLILTDSVENCIGVRVAEGWFCGRIGFEGGQRKIWGDRTALMAQLGLTTEDGEMRVIGTDESWEVASGPIRLAEIYHGEKYDSHYEIPDWSSARLKKETSVSVWSGATAINPLPTNVNLLAFTGAPIRRLHVLKPQQVMTSPSGKLILDFAQNLVGYTCIKFIKGEAGQEISLFHAEVLEHGECARRPLREADAMDKYKLKGDPMGESWEPRFTFHGYRYVQVNGLPAGADPLTSLEAVVVHTEMEPAGSFSCSNEMLNKLHENVRWGMRGNFVGLPTDCPQRDERLGWTGDIALFGPTACFLFDCTGMLMSWLADLTVDQAVLGGVPPLVCPNVLLKQKTGFPRVLPCAIWSDVTILLPWAMYQSTGDITILATQYHSMQVWIRAVPRDSTNNSPLYDPKTLQLGDWLDPDAPPDSPGEAKTNNHLVANAFLVRSLDLMSKISSILGNSTDAKTYADDTAAVKKAFADEYISPNGRMTSDSQTAYALGISFDLFPLPDQKKRAASRLAQIVRKNGFRLPYRHRLRGHTVHLRSSGEQRSRPDRVCYACGGEVSELAISRH